MSFWGAVLNTVVPAALNIYGAKQSSKAADKAASQATSATQAGVKAQQDALDFSKQVYQDSRTAASPGLRATQNIVQRGSDLTPEQEQAVIDSRRQSLNALQGSSLRGSARATSALIADTDKRVRNNFMSQNRNASDRAALSLTGQYFNSNNQIANNATQSGNVASQGLTTQGNIQAANTLGQSAIKGQAIGDIGAIIADSLKQNQQKQQKYQQIDSGDQA